MYPELEHSDFEEMKPLNEVVQRENPEKRTQKKIDLVLETERFKRLWKSESIGKLNIESKYNADDINCRSSTANTSSLKLKASREIYNIVGAAQKFVILWKTKEVLNSSNPVTDVDDTDYFIRNEEDIQTSYPLNLIQGGIRLKNVSKDKNIKRDEVENTSIPVTHVDETHYFNRSDEEKQTRYPLKLILGRIRSKNVSKEKNIKITDITVQRDDKKHYCNDCPKSYRNKSNLKAHVKKFHGRETHVCRFCNKVCNTLDTFKLHAKSHQDCHSCTVCGNGYKLKSSLVKHMKIHSELK